MKAFLLAGGLGERLRPLTNHIPKCLVPINGVPLLQIWLDLCLRHHIEDVLINVSRHADLVEAFLESQEWGLNVRLVREIDPQGNAGTVLANREFIRGEESFFIFYTDNLTNVSLDPLLRFHQSHEATLSMGLFRTPTPRSSGIVDIAPNGLIRRFDEKPVLPVGNLANAGIYVARAALLDAIPRNRPVVDFGTDVFPHLIGRMYGRLVEGYLLDIGNPEALAKGCTEWARRT